MGGDERIALWAVRQRAKALHVGTYEAAVRNMLRRIDDRRNYGREFYLYRIHLEVSVIVGEGWVANPVDWFGEVALEHVCRPEVAVARYLNRHEDPGGLSFALEAWCDRSCAVARGATAGWVERLWVRDATG